MNKIESLWAEPSSLAPDTQALLVLLLSFPLLVWSAASAFHTGHAAFKMLSSLAFLAGSLLHPLAPPSEYRTVVLAGLVLSFLGDVCLIPPSPGKPLAPGPRSASNWFKAGLLCFSLAHVAYAAAFFRSARAVSWPVFASVFALNMFLARAAGVTAPPAPASAQRRGSANLLGLAVPPGLRVLVIGYAGIISVMLAAAAATVDGAGSGRASPCFQQRLVGALMFVVSDLFVAHDAFGGAPGRSVPQTKAGDVLTEEHGLESRSAGMERHGWLVIALGYGLYFWGQMLISRSTYICG